MTITIAQGSAAHGSRQLTRTQIAQRVAADIPPGSFVNLGIGQPTTVADHFDTDDGVVLHTENGMLNMGPLAPDGRGDPDLINAGKQPVTELPGASFFHQADSFAMMRGGHLDISVLGAFEVSTSGDLANWHLGDLHSVPAVGGAMDLAVGAQQVFVMMPLFTSTGSPKLVEHCTLPLTAVGCVTRIYSDVAIVDLTDGGAVIRETFGVRPPDLRDKLRELWRAAR